MSIESLILEKNIHAPLAQLYRAFTNSTAFREWMCDQCFAEPRPQGRLYFGWFGGFYGAGEYTSLEPEHSVTFTWMGRGEPGTSWVKVTLTPQETSTHLRLEHGGLGEDEVWERARKVWLMSWESGLENLASVLETGRDLRIVNRPMLGIMLDDFNAEIAAHLGMPVSQGVRLSGVIDGMGAQAAGLQADDVIIRLGEVEIKEYSDLGNALQFARAGNEIAVEFYRAAEKITANFKLSGRPIPEIPASAQELAAIVEKTYHEISPALDQLFTGVTEAEAGFKATPQEWSAKETLAHLIHVERGLHNGLGETVGSFEAQYDTYGSNWTGRNQATVAAYPTTADLVSEYKRLMAETVALYASLPEEFIARKGSYWQLAFNALQAPSYHFNSHVTQIKAALEAARPSKETSIE